MKTQKIERGYVTYALTDDTGYIYGSELKTINWAAYLPTFPERVYYWSEVYCETGLMTIIRKGTHLVNPSPEKLTAMDKQSFNNLRGADKQLTPEEDDIIKHYSR